MNNTRKILLIIAGIALCVAALTIYITRRPVPEALKTQEIDDGLKQEVAGFLRMADDALKKDGPGAFRGFWVKVEEPQFASGLKLSQDYGKNPYEVIAVVSPKTAKRHIYAFLRHVSSNLDLQYILSREPGGLKIEAIYETKTMR